MKLLSSSNDIREITIDEGPVIKRDKDATFDVPDSIGKGMKKGSEFAVVGTTLRNVKQSFTCPKCHRENVIRDSCGCGWHE
jgi:hypothetical protein